ncbi:MAG: hypothetical protein K0S33_1577 [Bacteroidetes bacterium]|jgi:hypothetical protein|nr:hypothetical protein [Bacteroidota bacterium]
MKSFLFSAFLFLVVSGYSQSVIIPASNAGVSNGGNSIKRKPLGAYYGYERSAFIYSSYELGMTDTTGILSISFYMETLSTTVASNMPVKIYMKDITDTAFVMASGLSTELSGATLVYNGGLANTDFASNSWITLNLGTPFIHYPAKSLEIIIETNVGGAGSDPSPVSKEFRRNATSVKRFQYWQQDNTVPTGTGALDTLRPNITINYSAANPCTGIPVAGMALPSDSAVCLNSTVDLILTGTNPGTSISYQWQASADGVNFTDIAGANQQSYIHTMTALTWFRGIVSCGSNSDTSTVGRVGILLPVYCYCSATLGGGCATHSVDSLSIQGTGFNASLNGCENNAAPHYSTYPATGNYTATLSAGQTYTMTIRQTGSNITSLWIDYDHDGVFGVNEWTQLNTSSITNGLLHKAFTLPADAYNGLTGMRVRSRATTALVNDSTDACTGFASGETEDFLITITGGGTIGIADPISTADVTIFPNPNKGSFTIETSTTNTAWLVEVSDVLGKVVLSQTEESGDGKIAVQLNTAPGVYFVKGINILNRSAFVKKVIVE